MVKARKKPTKTRTKTKTKAKTKKLAKKVVLRSRRMAKLAKLKAKPRVKRAKEPEVLEPCEFCGVADEEAKVFVCPKCKREGCIHCMPAGAEICPECEEALNAAAEAKADEPPEQIAAVDDVDDAPITDPVYTKPPPTDEDEGSSKAVDAGDEGEPGSLFVTCSESGNVAGTVSTDDDDADAGDDVDKEKV